MTTSKDAIIPVYVVHVEDNFPSLDELDNRRFPLSELDAGKVPFKSVMERFLFSPLGENADGQ